MIYTYTKKGLEFAHYSRYEDKKRKFVNLGRVIDLKNGIFEDRRGRFSFDEKSGARAYLGGDVKIRSHPTGSVDFGDTYFLSGVFAKLGLDDAIRKSGIASPDLFKAMVLYYLSSQTPNSYASDWYGGNYVRYLLPDADMSDRRISEYLKEIGNDGTRLAMIKSYLGTLDLKGAISILVDSTGLPNNIHVYFTAVSTHDGVTSVCSRLIVVLRESDSMPIYYRLIPGSVLDVATLKNIIAEVGKMGVAIDNCVVDAGYDSIGNITGMLREGIPFLTRLKENFVGYKRLRSKWMGALEDQKHSLLHDGKIYQIAEDTLTIGGRRLNAYVCIDKSMQAYNIIALGQKAKATLEGKDIYGQNKYDDGFFVLVSSKKYDRREILREYYLRQRIEQGFDLSKNTTNILPLRTHGEETLQGHILISFFAQIVSQYVQNCLKDKRRSLGQILMALRNQKAIVYPNSLLPLETTRNASLAYKSLDIAQPREIRIKDGCAN